MCDCVSLDDGYLWADKLMMQSVMRHGAAHGARQQQQKKQSVATTTWCIIAWRKTRLCKSGHHTVYKHVRVSWDKCGLITNTTPLRDKCLQTLLKAHAWHTRHTRPIWISESVWFMNLDEPQNLYDTIWINMNPRICLNRYENRIMIMKQSACSRKWYPGKP